MVQEARSSDWRRTHARSDATKSALLHLLLQPPDDLALLARFCLHRQEECMVCSCN